MKRALFAMLLVACRSSSNGHDDGPTPYTPVMLAPPAAGNDPAVFLRTHAEQDRYVVEVVTRATPALSGAALRLTYPSWLHFDHRDESAGWADGTMHHTRTSDAAQLILVDVAKGKVAAHPAPAEGGESVLTTLYFTRDKEPPGDLGSLAFVVRRSALQDEAAKPVAVTFYDQAFSR